MKMIWGMTLEPGKLYTEIMGEEVQLSMAAIDSRKDLGEASNSNSFCQIVMKTSKGEYVLCTLIHGVMFQQSLDLKLMPREKVTFSVQGPSVVYLVGYTASYPEDEELDLEEDVEAGDDSSAWEAFDTDDQSIDQVKQETVEIEADDEDEVHTVTTEEFVAEAEGDGAEQNQVDPEQDNMEDDLQKEGEEEMIFSVADLEPTEIKSEAPTPKPDSPSASSQQVMVSQVTPEDDLFNIQSTDGGMPLPEADANADFFYPETQQQPDVPVTPVSFQPSNTPADFQQHNPQGVLPSESFMPPQKTFVQRTQPSPQRRGNMQQLNTQRTYPPQRRQYGTNRNQPASKTRLQQQRQPVNVQQVRNISNIQQQQQSIPGTSQQDMPGPSTSGRWDRLSPEVPPVEERCFSPGGNPQTYPSKVHFPPSHMISNPAGMDSVTGISKPWPGKGRENYGTSKSGADSRRLPVGSLVDHARGLRKVTGPNDRDAMPSDLTQFELFCKYCGKKFANRTKCKAHERNHTLKRCHQCDTCSKSFTSRVDLLRHIRTHTGERPFRCKVCFQRFSRNSSLTRHQLRHKKKEL